MKRKLITLFFLILMVSAAFAETDMGNLGKIDYIYLLRTNIVMLAILAVSLFSLAAILEKFVFFSRIKFNSKKTMQAIEKFIKSGDDESIKKYCAKHNPLNLVIKTIIDNKNRPKSDLEEVYEIVRSQEKENMERFMVVLGSSAAVSPLLGLLGTVTGIIKAFADLAAAGTGGPSVVAAGVSEALVTTAFGLVVAIPVLIIFNIFNNKIRIILADLDVNIRLLFFTMEKK
ncbi:MAG: MotA/TolQ/ExbB proton channel family protein [bacterium]|nr:MotA/TolQ/ExbB proton channel family protein [bacterium]